MYEIKTFEHSDIETLRNSDIVKKFFSYLDVTPITAKAYSIGIRQFMKYITERGIKSPVREDVIEYKKELQASGKKPSTVALYLSALRRFFSWCEAEGFYENITAGVKSPKQERGHKRDYFSGQQIGEILKGMPRLTVEDKRNYAMFLLMSVCGLRTIELVRADICDIRTVAGTTLLNIQGKGRADKKEFVKLSEPVIAAVHEYLSARGQFKNTEPLFVSCSKRNRNQRITTRTVSNVAKAAMKEAGYDSTRLTAHSLRHSAATLALQAGMPLAEVSQFLRHSSIAVTMVYAHHVERMKSQCENAITNAIFAA